MLIITHHFLKKKKKKNASGTASLEHKFSVVRIKIIWKGRDERERREDS